MAKTKLNIKQPIQGITIVPIDSVKQNPENPRIINDDNFKKLVQSIKDFPEMLQLRPIVVNKERIILGGNMRHKACVEAGLKEVPIISAESLTEAQQREFVVKDNVSGGEWDWELLVEQYTETELSEWGLEVPESEEAEQLEAQEDDFDATPPEIHDTVLGDLYEIGQHRLLCGDSTCSDTVAKLMNGEKVEIVFTSPPYNLGSNVSLSTRGKTDNAYTTYDDSQSEEKYNELLQGFTNSFWEYCNYLIVNIQSLAGNKKSVIDYQHIYRDNISDISVWVKSNPQPAMAKNVMNSAFEYFIFVNTGDNVTRAINTGDFRGTFSNVYNGTVNSENDVKEHKAAFSASMCGDFLKTFSKVSVADCFMGTGTTMVAAHQLKRKCYGIELDPKYCDVIVKRMIKLDPTLTIKRNGVDETKKWLDKTLIKE